MNSKTRPQISTVIQAMRSPNSWRALKMAQAAAIAGKVEKEKSQKFAEYVDKVFLSVCDELHVFEKARNWANLPDIEKLAIADDIIKNFVKRIRGAAQSKSNNNSQMSALGNSREIFVRKSDTGQMSVSNEGCLNINLKNLFYKDLAWFLMDLRHEAAHVVDIFFPALSALDSDIRDRSMAFYVKPHEDRNLYSKNPLEMTANTGRENFNEIVRAKIALCEYERMRAAMNLAGIGRLRMR